MVSDGALQQRQVQVPEIVAGGRVEVVPLRQVDVVDPLVTACSRLQ